MLCHCDINTHSTAVMMRQMNIAGRLQGVYHLGAHDGIEANIYDAYGAKYVVWVEANKLVFPYLLERLGGRKNHYAFCEALDEESGRTVPFYFYRDKTDGAGGMYKPEKMMDYIHDCPMLDEATEVTTITTDDLIEKYDLPFRDCNFLNIDVQGAELRVLKGAQKLLRQSNIKYIWCEVSWDHVYQDAPLQKDIDEYLMGFGFKRIYTRPDWEIHGDAFYMRIL